MTSFDTILCHIFFHISITEWVSYGVFLSLLYCISFCFAFSLSLAFILTCARVTSFNSTQSFLSWSISCIFFTNVFLLLYLYFYLYLCLPRSRIVMHHLDIMPFMRFIFLQPVSTDASVFRLEFTGLVKIGVGIGVGIGIAAKINRRVGIGGRHIFSKSPVRFGRFKRLSSSVFDHFEK